MSNIIIVIAEREIFGKNFEIYGSNENPLFLAKTVATWIEHSNPTEMIRNIDDNEKLNSIILSSGQKREVTFLTEDGLYEVLMQSKKPIAKEFKKEVKKILKEIRLTGGYIPTNEADDEETIMSKAIIIAHRTIERKDRIIENQNKKIEELLPKASYYDAILHNKDIMAVTLIAKDYGMSAKTFNDTLYLLGVQYRCDDCWVLYQKYADKGYTQTKTYPIKENRSAIHTYWTNKGRLFLYDLLKQKSILPSIEKNVGGIDHV